MRCALSLRTLYVCVCSVCACTCKVLAMSSGDSGALPNKESFHSLEVPRCLHFLLHTHPGSLPTFCYSDYWQILFVFFFILLLYFGKKKNIAVSFFCCLAQQLQPSFKPPTPTFSSVLPCPKHAHAHTHMCTLTTHSLLHICFHGPGPCR